MARYDLLVIGSGPAGQRAAVQAAKLGRRAAIVEKRQVVGGVCINTGTIPSKTLREAVLYLTGFGQRTIYGASYMVKQHITMEDLMLRATHVIRREIEVIESQMRRNNVEMLSGDASFVDPHTVRVAGALETVTVKADHIVIAAGTGPAPPPGVTGVHPNVIDSDSILDVKTIPRSLTVVGAGVIGIEYASIFATLGVAVTVVDRRDRLLEFVDDEIVESLSYQMRQCGTTFRLGEDVRRISCAQGKAVAELASGKTIVSDLALFSAGRIGATAGLNLEAAGLQADERGRIAVDDHFRTRVPHISAAGDIIGFPSLASTSMEQGRLAAAYAFGKEAHPMPKLFPFGIYTIPEISMIGPTEAELTKGSVPYETGISRYREIARGQILGDDTGLLKLLFHRQSRRLLAAHAIGTGATELIHIAQAVVILGGTLDYFLTNVFNYPTLAECYKVAALDCANKLA